VRAETIAACQASITTMPALPTDPADLQQYCAQLLAELSTQQDLVAKLSHQLALLRRYLYGRRSEQLDPAQLLLEFASWVQAQQAEAVAAPPLPEPAPSRPRPGHGRAPLPALLPRRRVEHALPEDRCACGACGAPLMKIGEETSEQLDYQPASLFVIEHVRFTYACRACEGTVVTAELPAAPIEKGRPGPGLLAQVITAKYADHLPLNRQTEIFARHGVTLARQTLGDWVAAAAHLLTPIYADLKACVLTSKVIHTDDTVVPVLDHALPQTRDGRLWVYVGDGHPGDIVYDYTTDRSRAGPTAFLGDFRGYLQADAYAGYDALYATGRIVEVGCMAHARRHFWDAKASDPPRALLALGFIQELYVVERAAKAGDAAARRALRQEQACPVLKRFRDWLDEQADILLPKSPIGQAVGYARAQWTALTRYCDDGDLAIDNNVSERALRKVVTGRNNWTFCGSDAGGERAAILYSVVATCKAHGIDPWAYLRDVLERIPTHPNRRRAELLPRHWKAAQTEMPA
jgi:transposase